MTKTKAEKTVARTTFHCYRCMKAKPNAERSNPRKSPACCNVCAETPRKQQKPGRKKSVDYTSGKSGDYFANIDNFKYPED